MTDLSPDAKKLWGERQERWPRAERRADRARSSGRIHRIALGPNAPGGGFVDRVASEVGENRGLVRRARRSRGHGGRADAVPRPLRALPRPPRRWPPPRPPKRSLLRRHRRRRKPKPFRRTKRVAFGQAADRHRPRRSFRQSSGGEAPSDTLAEEVRIVTAARLALRRSAFAEALTSANDYAGRFPKGVFLEEQLAIRILALCGLGRDKKPFAHSEHFERTVPSSRQLDRVDLRAPARRGSRPGHCGKSAHIGREE